LSDETLYVHRPLLNADEIISWAKGQGFPKTLSPDDMHVTVTFSKKAFDWSGLKEQNNKVHVRGGPRDVDHLGEKGAIVLHFESPELHDRWQEIVDEGASWDYDDYHPHISITYDGGDLDPSNISPWQGELIFGPEIFRPLEEDWDEKIDEVPTETSNRGVLERKSGPTIKYQASIMENKLMNESLASLLMKNIDLILEAYNVDEKGNLVEVNKKKVSESDEIFHKYFVQSMNNMFRQINENDPILGEMPNEMGHPGEMNGMHPMAAAHHGHPQHAGMPQGMGMGGDGMADDGIGGDEHMGHLAMNDMMDPQHVPGMGMHQDHGHPQFESQDGGEYDWVFGENTDLNIDSLFGLTEEEDEEEKAEHEEGEEHLKEFMDDGADFLPDGGMDHDGGHTGFDGDMGGTSMDLDSGMDQHGDDGMGGDDMITLHGQTDGGGEFEISFEKDALGFDGEGGDGSDDMSGGDDMSGFGGGGDDMHMDNEPGMGDEEEHPMEAANGFHNGKPGHGKAKGPKSRMAVVPANPATKRTAPFPSPMGSRQKK
jgi:hypothetical protein